MAKATAEVKTRTAPQTKGTRGGRGELTRVVQRASYKKFRDMRRDSTLALARKMLRAGVLAGQWSLSQDERAPDGAVETLDKILQPLRTSILRTALIGWLDYGWQPWELIAEKQDDRWGAVLKPLLQEWTDILVDEGGTALGLRQESKENVPEVELQLGRDCLLMSFDVEGTDWYGTPLMWDSADAYDKWGVIEAAAARYDAKVAGTHWVVKYPVGVSKYKGREDTDNAEIADDLLLALESSGTIAIPKDVDKFLQAEASAQNLGWEVELVTDASAGRASFTERQKYLDALKVRGLGLPERAILEGQFGTKAEAGEHGDFAITNIELMHQTVVEQLNAPRVGLVSWLLRANFGQDLEGSVWIEASPIADKSIAFLRQVYQALLASPDAGLEETGNIDMTALRDRLAVPGVSSVGMNEGADGTEDDAELEIAASLAVRRGS